MHPYQKAIWLVNTCGAPDIATAGRMLAECSKQARQARRGLLGRIRAGELGVRDFEKVRLPYKD